MIPICFCHCNVGSQTALYSPWGKELDQPESDLGSRWALQLTGGSLPPASFFSP